MSSREGIVPCAVCTHLRRACTPDCACAPYFPHGDTRFAVVDRVFDASSVADVLAELAPEQRADVVESIVATAVACLQRVPALVEKGKDAGAGTSAPRDRGHRQEQPNTLMVQQAADASQRTEHAAVQPGGNGRGVLDGHVHGPSRLETVQRSAPTSKGMSSREGVVPCAVCTHLCDREHGQEQPKQTTVGAQPASSAGQTERGHALTVQQAADASQRSQHVAVQRVAGSSESAAAAQAAREHAAAQAAREKALMMQHAAMQAAREKALMTRQAAAREQALMTQRNQHAPVQLGGVRRDVPDGHVQGPPRKQQRVTGLANPACHVHSQQMLLPTAGAQNREQDAMKRIQIAASKHKAMMEQTAAASEAAARQAALQKQNYPQSAEQYRAWALEAQRRSQLIALQVEEAKKIADAAAQVSREQDLVLRATLQAGAAQVERVDAAEETDMDQLFLRVQQAAAAAGVTAEQYLTMVFQQQQQQDVAGGQQQQHHGQMQQDVVGGITGNQNATMIQQQDAAGYLGLKQEMTQQYQQPQQQHQQHAAAMHGSGFGATNMTFQQQLQLQPQVPNVQFQGEQSPSSWLAPLPPQLLPPPQETVNVFGSQVLPPPLADLPPQQQNVEGDEDPAEYLRKIYQDPPDGSR